MNLAALCQELELRDPVKNNEHTIHTFLDGKGKLMCVGLRPNGPNEPPTGTSRAPVAVWRTWLLEARRRDCVEEPKTLSKKPSKRAKQAQPGAIAAAIIACLLTCLVFR